MRKSLEWMASPLLALLMIAAWQYYVVSAGVSPFILPKPMAVWIGFVELPRRHRWRWR